MTMLYLTLVKRALRGNILEQEPIFFPRLPTDGSIVESFPEYVFEARSFPNQRAHPLPDQSQYSLLYPTV